MTSVQLRTLAMAVRHAADVKRWVLRGAMLTREPAQFGDLAAACLELLDEVDAARTLLGAQEGETVDEAARRLVEHHEALCSEYALLFERATTLLQPEVPAERTGEVA